MIKAHDLRVVLGGSEILRGVSIEVPRGTAVALVGPNGAGKTTTLRSIMGLVKYKGRVELDGRPIDGLKPHERAALGLGLSPEDRRLFPNLTVRENILLPLRALKLREDRLELVLSLMPVLRELLEKRAGLLSGGQQKMVALARAMVVGTSAVLLDEVFEGLSPKMRDDLAGVIKEFISTTGAAALIAESNPSYVRFAQAIKRIERGRITG